MCSSDLPPLGRGHPSGGEAGEFEVHVRGWRHLRQAQEELVVGDDGEGGVEPAQALQHVGVGGGFTWGSSLATL